MLCVYKLILSNSLFFIGRCFIVISLNNPLHNLSASSLICFKKQFYYCYEYVYIGVGCHSGTFIFLVGKPVNFLCGLLWGEYSIIALLIGTLKGL